MTAIVNIETTNEADFVRGFLVTVGGVPLDLTGSRLFMMGRIRPEVAEVSISLDSEEIGGFTITDPVNGKFTMTIPRARLARMPAGIYSHSLIRERPDSLLEPVWKGTITHSIGPTR